MKKYFKLWSLSLSVLAHPSYTRNIPIVISKNHSDSKNCHN